MLLRRITKHIKDQNWFAVGVDFVIVVVGVFIGIQVANWNDTRNNEAALKASLARLDKEVTQNLDLIHNVLGYYKKGQHNYTRGREALNTCDASNDGQAALEALLFDLVSDVQPNFTTVALDQLAGESRYQGLLTPQFEADFGAYAGRLREEHEQLTSHYERMWAQHVNYHPAVTAYFPGDNETGGGEWRFALAQPFETVCADTEFRTRFIHSIGFYWSIGRRLDRLKGEIETFQTSLAAELERH